MQNQSITEEFMSPMPLHNYNGMVGANVCGRVIWVVVDVITCVM